MDKHGSALRATCLALIGCGIALLLLFQAVNRVDTTSAEYSTGVAAAEQTGAHPDVTRVGPELRSPAEATGPRSDPMLAAGSGPSSLPGVEVPAVRASGDLTDEILGLDVFSAMSAGELRAERSRLSALLGNATTPIHAALFQGGLGYYWGPTGTEVSTAMIPREFQPLLTSFHQSGGDDGVYLTVIDPNQHPEIYSLKDACELLASLEHEKLHGR